MNLIYYILLSSSALVLDAYAAEEYPIVQINKGKVKGLFAWSREGRTYYSFRGIPYAKPPIGPLRFKSPEPVNAWTEELNAQKDAPNCIQKNYLFGKLTEGSEDCLYLNVYTPRINLSKKKLLLPVMVFIHWGGFFTGYGSSNYLGPDYFMDKNVVLVTFNYRLGVFGFLSTFNDDAPGNYGLKDQVAALEWVKDNIQDFGGDSNKVTLFGQSAGGASVHFHMFHPKSQNLFHQGISQSGTALALWAKPLGIEQKQIANLQATFVGCGHFVNNTKNLVNCLRNVDAKTLVESGDNFKYFSIDPVTVFLPSIEKKTANNSDPFLTKQIIEYIKNGEFKKIPWILGTVSDEGIIRAAGLVSQPETLKELNSKFDKIMPSIMMLSMSTPKEKIQSVWQKIKNYYFGPGIINTDNPHNIKALIDLYTDRSFVYTTFQTALLHAKQSHNPVWLYNFNYKGNYSYGTYFAASTKDVNYKWGVSHCDDLLYLFKSSAMFPELTNPTDIFMSKVLVTLWTNFATYGNPTPSSLFKNEQKWLKLETNIRENYNLNKNLNYLQIIGNYQEENSVQLRVQNGFYQDRYKFWEKLPLSENIDELNQRHVEL